MKQCPNPECKRIYDDDSLSYCLDDGVALVPVFDPEATHINTPIPPVPTIASNNPTLPMPKPEPMPIPVSRSKLRPVVLGTLATGILLGVGITLWMLQKSSATASNQPPTTPTPIRIVATSTPTPTPSPLTSPSPKNVESEPECMLYNDKADRSGVNARVDCDTKNCDSDPTTLTKREYPDKTRVHVIKDSKVQGKRFQWVKVDIVGTSTTVWVAASKIKC
jgi:hypothetical protein